MGFIEKTRCVNRGAEIRRILDTKALRQASNLELLRQPPDVKGIGGRRGRGGRRGCDEGCARRRATATAVADIKVIFVRKAFYDPQHNRRC